MKKKMLALVLAGIMSCNMGISVLAADDVQAVKEPEVVTEITEEAVAEQEEGYTGWDDSGEYYYENGEMIKNQVYVIDGIWYAFGYEGELVRNNECSFRNEENGEWRAYCSDQEGRLISGWVERYDGKSFYDLDEYYQYFDLVFEDEWGDKYYMDDMGHLVISADVFYDGVLYEADEYGVLTEKSVGQTGWIFANGYWYYLIDGEPVTNQILTIKGSDYYFYSSGKMAVGSFMYDAEGLVGYKFAESDGRIVKSKNTWCKNNYGTYYIGEDGWLVRGGFAEIDGNKYYFDYDGAVYVGAYSVFDEESGKNISYIADKNGVIVSSNGTGWVNVEGSWYYYKADGSLAREEIVEIGGKGYCFNWNSIMQTGRFWYDEKEYLADASGALGKNKWILYQDDWYYSGDDYSLCIGGVYTINGKRYVLDWKGAMSTGHVGIYDTEKNVYYLTDESGAILEGKGWRYYGLNYYYSNEDGSLYQNQWIDDTYFIDYEGKMAVGTYYINDEIYYFDSNGRCKENLSSEHPNGWKIVDGYWYYYDENGLPFTGVVDSTYYIENGEMMTNMYLRVEDEYGDSCMVYLGYDGKIVRNGWYKAEYNYDDYYSWIYADKDGILVENGWKQIGANWYYFREGEALRGIAEINGKIEIFDENCVWDSTHYKGWKKINGYWHYFEQDGTMLVNQKTAVINGTTFYFWDDGTLKCNWMEINPVTKEIFYLDANGYKQYFTGWKYVDGEWYYADASGKAVSGLKYIGGSYYKFFDGLMEKGNIYVEEWGGTYFFGASGAYQNVKNGWVSDGYSWYYFVNGKALKRGIHVINGTTYAFGYDGQMIRGRYNDYLFSDSGALLRNGWYQSPNGKWYYADASGRYVYGQRTIGGRTYWFTDGGRMIK